MENSSNLYGKKLLFIVDNCFSITSRELSLNDVYIAVVLETSFEPIPLSEDNLKRRIRDKLDCLYSIKKIDRIEYRTEKNVKYYKYKRK
jgi:hypothetical protein